MMVELRDHHELLNHTDYQMEVRCAARARTSRTAFGGSGTFHRPPAASATNK